MSATVHSNAWLTPNRVDASDLDLIAVVYLNTSSITDILEELWKVAAVKICADGGANHLYDSGKRRGSMMPDIIKGDLDSLRPDVSAYYGDRGTQIIQDSNQDTHDLDKCIQSLFEQQQNSTKKYTVVVFGAFGGRLDQEMANINMLFRWQGKFHRIVLISDRSLGFLLPAGTHTIDVNEAVEGPVCGLIPIAGTCESVTTTGLKWNLADTRTGFGGLVSSSNQVTGPTVTVTTSHDILWTTVMKQREDA